MTSRANRIQQTLDTAVWAPSGDNTQPWYFAVVENVVYIHLLPKLDNPILNFNLSGTYIAHGALVENLLLAAPLFGLKGTLRLFPDSNDPYCTAAITFMDSAEEPSPLAYVIHSRHSNRKSYQNRSLDGEVRKALEEAGKELDGAKSFFLTDAIRIKKVSHAAALMEQVALETPAISTLFFSGILWTKEENQAGKPGLYIHTMEVPPPAKLIFKYLRYRGFARFMNRIGFPKAARRANAKLYATAPVFGLVTINEESPASYISTGRVMQRIWLSATQAGLAFQPVTGLLFLARSIANDAATALLPAHLDEIKEASNTISQAFGLTKGQIPGMMFRMGYAAPVTARSFRHLPDIRHD